MDERMHGTGPGVIAPDGSPVEFYRRLEPGRSLTLVADRLTAASSVLDLGCGVGRIADALADRGHAVVGVDVEPAMLAQVERAETVHADIGALDLRPRVFDAVLLLSNLVNHPDARTRARFLATCRRHVRESGVVLIGHLNAEWALTACDGVTFEGDGIRISLRDVRCEPATFAATVVYEADEQTWTQTFENTILDDDALDAALRGAGLRRAYRLDPTLLAARPAG